MSEHQEHLTLIVVADETSPMRRIRFRRVTLIRAAVGAGLVLLATLALFADYTRLRIERPEVAALRAQTAIQEEELVELQERVRSLHGSLDELGELERKVRIIADLPPRDAVEAGTRAKEEHHPEGGPEGGMGGGDDLLAADEVERLSLRLDPARSSLEDLVVRLEAKRERLASMPSIRPTDGWETSGFGLRTSPFTGRRQFHRGLDIAADYGTEIVAPARGRVRFAGKKGPLGQTVILDHGYGTQTTFGHAKELFVSRGDVVDRGTRIAAVGNTGRSTGPHLHYVVSVKGKAVDPRDFILE